MVTMTSTSNLRRGAPRGPRTPQPLPDPGDIIWGAAGIAAVINRTERQVYNMLDKLPIQKVGGRYCASRSRLIEHCAGGTVGGAR